MSDAPIAAEPVGWEAVIGQPGAVATLRNASISPVHAYLFLGPHGSGRWAAAKAFAGEILSFGLEGEAAERATRLAHRGEHPDLIRIEPTGNEYRDAEVGFLITEASRSPVEGNRKVIVASRFHTANAKAIGRLLKTLEEPPESAIIVLLSEQVPEEQITIASRCLIVEFRAVPHADVVTWLVQRGVDPVRAETVAVASAGDLVRAGDLAGDDDVLNRHAAWSGALARLDGSGASVAVLVDELRAMIDDAQGPLTERHGQEMADLAAREDRLGTRGSGRRDLEAAHKREVRRLRMDELRFGFATLAGGCRDRLQAGPTPDMVKALDVIRDANEALIRNPGETLLLQSMFAKLARLV